MADGNTYALNKYLNECDKSDAEMEYAENKLFKDIEPFIDGLNNSIKMHAMFSVMDKKQCREYVIDTINELLEV